MFNKTEVLETVEMIEREHLDIRTITMGISLLPCIRESAEKKRRKLSTIPSAPRHMTS